MTSREGGGSSDADAAEDPPPGTSGGARVAFPRPSAGPLVRVGRRLLNHDEPEAAPLRATDRLITIRRAAGGPAAAPPG